MTENSCFYVISAIVPFLNGLNLKMSPSELLRDIAYFD